MNCTNLTLRELQILRYIGRNKHKSVSADSLIKKFDKAVIKTVIDLGDKHLITPSDSNKSFSITIGGYETLKDYRLHRRNDRIGHLIQAAIASTSTLLGVIVGYLLSFI